MNKENAFSYTYSAPEKQEVLDIRKKYMPREETKLEELRRLDGLVQNSGLVGSLAVGVGGSLVFGLGLCFAMEVIGKAMWLGILLGLTGAAGMCLAYPVHRRLFGKAKEKYTPRILELAAELSGGN